MTATILVAVLTALPAADRPRVVVLIRHAEKPADGDPSPDHIPAGMLRAEALPKLFQKSADRLDPLLAPEFIFAAKNSDHSHRSVRTVKPLAAALGLKIQSDIANDDYLKLVTELSRPRYAGKVVLVCWHHGNLPQLAGSLGATDAPPKWKDGVFDRVWQLDAAADGKWSIDWPEDIG